MHCGRFCRPPGFPLRTPESGLFPENVLFFCGKKRYNSFVLCVLPCFAHIFRAFPVKFAITTYPRKGTETNCGCNHWYCGESLQLIPARGRKQSASFHSSKSAGLQLIPARGRKPLYNFFNVRRVRITTYPRKGTETILSGVHTLASAHYNLSPQGDGNSTLNADSSKSSYYNLSPQGDGNGYTDWPVSYDFDYYNLSPQGDGNLKIDILISLSPRLQLIPARGRKHGADSLDLLVVFITTYPRKGTVTYFMPRRIF